MSNSDPTIQVDMNNQIKEYKEERETFVEQQQSQTSTEIVNETDTDEEDYGEGLDAEYFNPMNTQIIIDLPWPESSESSDENESTSINDRHL